MCAMFSFSLFAPRAPKSLFLKDTSDIFLLTKEGFKDLVYLLAVPLKSHQREFSSQIYTSQTACMSHNTSASILLLPGEVHLGIFAELEDVVDVVALGLASKYFWSLALPVLHDKWAAHLGLWAGEKIICVANSCLKRGEYPPELSEYIGILSPSSPRIYQHSYLVDDIDDLPIHHSLLSNLSNSSVSASDCKDQYLGKIWEKAQRKRFLSQCLDRLAHSRSIYERYIKPDFENYKADNFYPGDQPWILRNLTTKELVRSEAIALKPEYIHGPRIRGIGFEHVLVFRICWAPEHSDWYQGTLRSISKGVWAGHSFDIVQLSRHVEMTRGETWVDVSAEVMDEISTEWESIWGQKWRELVMLVAERQTPY
ncbi:hypothetical protein Daesc_004227 [Daldinia eschscholtzii]|uniref:F-box domain-containing protein n=1 Tax=Daldinia eschscholtzii TaxID=292717 RepID=A0AAX6MNL7_9PEZI